MTTRLTPTGLAPSVSNLRRHRALAAVCSMKPSFDLARRRPARSSPPRRRRQQQPPANRRSRPAQQPPTQHHRPRQGQQPPPQQSIRSGINFVRVDVIVTDKKGDAGAGHEAGRFRALARTASRRRSNRSTVVKIDPTTQIDAEAPQRDPQHRRRGARSQRPDVRLFVILLDDYHVRRGNDMAVRKPLIDFIQTSSRRRTWWR